MNTIEIIHTRHGRTIMIRTIILRDPIETLRGGSMQCSSTHSRFRRGTPWSDCRMRRLRNDGRKPMRRTRDSIRVAA